MSNEHVVPALTRSEAAPVEGGSPGAMIREARTKARMSVEELAAATKLAKHTLEALEKDDFNALQEAVYVRGYYRKCAKILKISEARLIESYNGRAVPKRPDAPSKLRLASGTEIGDTNPLPIPMAVGSAVAAVVVGILLWNLFKSPDEPAPVQVSTESVTIEPQVSAVPEDAAGTAAVPAAVMPEPVAAEGATPAPADSAGAATTPAVPATTPAASAAVPAAATASTPPPAAAQAVQPPPPPKPAAPEVPPKSVSLRFTGTSWARIEDSSGKILLNGLMREGENRTLRGRPPFAVFLGNGPGVAVEFEGSAVDFSSHVSDNLTARFTVP